VEGCDGALIGFAGFAPELMIQIVHCALDGDIKGAKAAQQLVAPLARVIFNFGEPGCGAHQRMKVSRWLMGKFSSPHFRRPLRPLARDEVGRLREELQKLGFACRSLSSNGQLKRPSTKTGPRSAAARRPMRINR
jgi:4-hydroxy-tetrahydrodipicolinate synthase